MPFSFDGDPTTHLRRCGDCEVEHEAVNGFVLRDGSAYAIYFADWYPHQQEAWIDVILGSFGEEHYPDNVTFGCRVGEVVNSNEPAATVVEAATVRPESAIFGRKLDRGTALAHPRLSDFWEVVDWLIVNDPMLHRELFHFGHPA